MVHQERNWTYVLVEGAGHLIPYNAPSRVSALSIAFLMPYTVQYLTRAPARLQGLALFREFIFGNSLLGLVTTAVDGAVTVEGGEDLLLAVDAIRGQEGIFVGSISTTSTFTYPAATIAAWDKFIATATATATATVLLPQATNANAGRDIHVVKRNDAAAAATVLVGGRAAGGALAVAVGAVAFVFMVMAST